MNEKTINNWLALAEYDIKTAKAMLESKRYLYVAFTCQQCIEKVLKAIYVKEKNETPPYTHNLINLITLVSFASEFSKEQKLFLELLNLFYIESRYAQDLENAEKILKKETPENILDQTEKIYLWLLHRM